MSGLTLSVPYRCVGEEKVRLVNWVIKTIQNNLKVPFLHFTDITDNLYEVLIQHKNTTDWAKKASNYQLH